MHCPVLFCFITDLIILSGNTEHNDSDVIKVKGYTVSQLLQQPSGWQSAHLFVLAAE